MFLKTHINDLSVNKLTMWQALLGKALLFTCLCTYVGYLCWVSEKALVFVGAGFLIMLIAYWKPFCKMTVPPEICWDLFALIMYFAVFLELYETMIEQPGMKILLSVNWVQDFHERVGHWPLWVAISCNYIIGDFMAYWSHRLFHTQWFWHSHAFHHSSKHLNWISGVRSSFGHIVGLFIPYAIVLVFFPLPKAGVIATYILIFDTINQHYIHSNLRFPFQKQLEWLFVTPRVHFVHHSTLRGHSDSNYGFIFTVWDRCFGTYTDPETVDPNEPLGLNYEISYWRLLAGLPKPRV
jgi:sterol desaturase/sphingolipid hydroxylase (fatty acid hydroxylase superfamily)